MEDVGQDTYTQVVHALICRLITEEVLKEAHEVVTIANQGENEDEAAFGVRVMKEPRHCRHVFTSMVLVNMYVRGLITEIHGTAIQQVRLIPPGQRGSM